MNAGDTAPVRNSDIARAAYAALEARDLEAFLALVDPDVEFTSLIAEVEQERFVGHDGVRRWWDQVVESLGGLQFELVSVTETGDDTAVIHNRIVGPAGVQQQMWQAVRVRDGRAVWWGAFRSEREALDAL